ncbi:MAG: elongation factor G [Candidatus Eisenbacteria bacterium]|uniref:Elongation factor G n=1 Tax=Eiseniibacteriota bacterium TaxID=2212470 RepID=A0A538T0P1_UNCEI|nr:MAG: elongation factor G [Candidatus Eisenbacteria bacterium]TMQ57209.1 MAG: elongation factor G [Candidatus Eisenbacteria bacterium]
MPVKDLQPSNIRNIALCSPHGTGKTSLAESLLYRAKVTTRHGKVEEGTTALDFSPEEIHRKITVSLGVAPLEWRDTKVNLLDTPGYADFVGDLVAGLRVADAAAFCIKASAGIEAGSEMVWDRVEERGCPVICLVTQMEKEHAAFAKALDGATSRLGKRFVPLAFPIGEGEKFRGLVDLLSMKGYLFEKDGSAKEAPLPPEVEADAQKARGALVDAAAEADDALLEKFLGGGELSVEEVRRGVRSGFLNKSFVPALPVASYPMMGIDHVLDTFVWLLPSPVDCGPVTGVKPGTEEKVELPVQPHGHLAALIFKTSSETHAGDLSMIRVFAGTLVPGKEVWNASAQRAEKIGQLFHVSGKERKDAPNLIAGDVGAAVKLRESHTGQTLCEKNFPILLRPIPFPHHELEVAIFVKNKADEEKMGSGLHKLREEDPTLHVHVDSSLHQTLLQATGDLQVDVIVEKLQRRFGVHVELAKPRIPYRETIRRSVSKQGRHKKQTGGRGQFGDVHVRLEPLKSGSGFEFVDEIVGGSVPRNYIPAVEKGIIEAMHEGVLAGYPVVDVRAALYDGSYHTVDSSEMAFKIAGSMAFKEGAKEAGPILLEPIVEVEVRVPKDFVGSVTGDLSSKRGKILGMGEEGRYEVIRAHVPQAELYKYSTHLRSLTQGRASHRTKFSHYEEIPREFAEKVVTQAKAEKEAMASA